jgi:hypothetical protein
VMSEICWALQLTESQPCNSYPNWDFSCFSSDTIGKCLNGTYERTVVISTLFLSIFSFWQSCCYVPQ